MIFDDLFILFLAVVFLTIHVSIRWYMADLTPLSAQVDATLHTMSSVVAQLKAHIDAFAVATDTDAATVSDLLTKLKAGTDELDAALAAAKPALKS